MKLPDHIPVWGDVTFRGKCPKETVEQVSFFSRLRREYPDTYGRLALHPRNEGKRFHSQVVQQKAEGMTPGASDIIIPARIPFVCEMKRRDHTQCQWQDGQVEYLEAAQEAGASVCIALGALAAWEALEQWLTLQR